MRLLTPILLNYLIDYFDPDTTLSSRDAYLLAAGIGLAVVVQVSKTRREGRRTKIIPEKVE